VAAISGHTIDATTKIMEVYMPRNSVMARNAITKLEEYRLARRTDSEQAAKKLEG
jgi:hypothetical protein